MKETKFKVWDEDEKVMHQAVGICRIHLNHGIPYAVLLWEDEILLNFVLLEFIGAVDKDEAEIYRGDLVENCTGRRCEVVWFESQAFRGWDLRSVNGKGQPTPGHSLWTGWKVVGNTLENPEMLKDES